jgi:hypothetical protein
MLLYLSKWHEIYIVDYYEHACAAVIFLEFSVQRKYMFFISPYYLRKLIKVIK